MKSVRGSRRCKCMDEFMGNYLVGRMMTTMHENIQKRYSMLSSIIKVAFIELLFTQPKLMWD